MGNCFRTKEEAEHYSKRIESLSKGFIPKKKEKFWVYSWLMEDPVYDTREQGTDWLTQPKFKTEEECQAWYDEFGSAWEALYL